MPFDDSNTFVRTLFPRHSGECGSANLKATLKALPRGTEVVWAERPQRGIVFPPEPLLSDIDSLSKDLGIKMVLAPVLDDQRR